VFKTDKQMYKVY